MHIYTPHIHETSTELYFMFIYVHVTNSSLPLNGTFQNYPHRPIHIFLHTLQCTLLCFAQINIWFHLCTTDISDDKYPLSFVCMDGNLSAVVMDIAVISVPSLNSYPAVRWFLCHVIFLFPFSLAKKLCSNNSFLLSRTFPTAFVSSAQTWSNMARLEIILPILTWYEPNVCQKQWKTCYYVQCWQGRCLHVPLNLKHIYFWVQSSKILKLYLWIFPFILTWKTAPSNARDFSGMYTSWHPLLEFKYYVKGHSLVDLFVLVCRLDTAYSEYPRICPETFKLITCRAIRSAKIFMSCVIWCYKAHTDMLQRTLFLPPF